MRCCNTRDTHQINSIRRSETMPAEDNTKRAYTAAVHTSSPHRSMGYMHAISRPTSSLEGFRPMRACRVLVKLRRRGPSRPALSSAMSTEPSWLESKVLNDRFAFSRRSCSCFSSSSAACARKAAAVSRSLAAFCSATSLTSLAMRREDVGVADDGRRPLLRVVTADVDDLAACLGLASDHEEAPPPGATKAVVEPRRRAMRGTMLVVMGAIGDVAAVVAGCCCWSVVWIDQLWCWARVLVVMDESEQVGEAQVYGTLRLLSCSGGQSGICVSDHWV